MLPPSKKRAALVLILLLMLGTLLEMAGLGLIIPVFSLMLKADAVKETPFLQPYLESLGNPTHTEIIIGGVVLLITVYLIKGVFLSYLAWKQADFTMKLSAELGNNLYKGYLSQPYIFHLQKNSAYLSHNILDEVSRFSTITQSFIFIQTEASVMFGIAVTLLIVEPIGAISVSCFLGMCVLIYHTLTKKRLVKWGKQRKIHAELKNLHLLQGLGGVKDIKIMGKEDYFFKIFKFHNSTFSNINTNVNTLAQTPRLYLELMAVMGLSGLIITMVLQSKPLDYLLPILGIFAAASFRLIPSVNRIMISMQAIRFGKPAIDNLFNEIKSFPEIHNAVKEPEFTFTDAIRVVNLSFNYPSSENPALSNVNLTINKGSTVGFIGPSGSGKSTLIDLVLGLLVPSKGKILIDNIDLTSATRNWQMQVGYVSQSIYLIDDTIRRNVAFGLDDDEIDDQQVQRAIQAVDLKDFINELPQGLNTQVGERGTRLSGGQKQRIGIARALYHNPSVLVLDEATSSLDSHTEMSVMKSVEALKGQITILIIAHRLSTVNQCDWIYRLENGRVIAEGAPDLVLKKTTA